MLQKRDHRRNYEWTFTLSMVLYAFGVLAFAIYMLQTRGDLMIFAFALLTAPIAGWFAWEHERQGRRARGKRYPRTER